jgi:hypothetical protein
MTNIDKPMEAASFATPAEALAALERYPLYPVSGCHRQKASSRRFKSRACNHRRHTVCVQV